MSEEAAQPPNEIIPTLKCLKHQGEKVLRVCFHPNCENIFLCGECLFDEQEHIQQHKAQMKSIKELLTMAYEFYMTKRNIKSFQSEIPEYLSDFLNDHEIIKENLAEIFSQKSQFVDVLFEKCIKSFMDSISALREEIKMILKQNVENLLSNYQNIVNKIRTSYHLFSEEEISNLYPDQKTISNIFSQNDPGIFKDFINKLQQDMMTTNQTTTSLFSEQNNKHNHDAKEELSFLVDSFRDQMNKTDSSIKENSKALEKKVQELNEGFFTEVLLLTKTLQKELQTTSIKEYKKAPLKNEINKQENVISQYQLPKQQDEDEVPNHVHFFKQNSRNLYLCDLSDISKITSDYLKFERISLDCSFKISYDYSSLALSDGSIYITGGTDTQHHFQDVFKYSITYKTCSILPPMLKKRSSHSMAYLQNTIFVIGGYDGDQVLSECEAFNLKSLNWVPIASLNEAMSCGTVCSFNNKYIYKFGGLSHNETYTQIVERYDFDMNIWDPIELRMHDSSLWESLLFRESSESIQINRKQIIIFGGKNKNSSLDSTLLVDVDELNISVKLHFQAKLPFPEYFRCPKNVTIKDGKVYVVSFYMKKVFCFDGIEWKTMN